jgi:hypothetical protein
VPEKLPTENGVVRTVYCVKGIRLDDSLNLGLLNNVTSVIKDIWLTFMVMDGG